MEETRVEANAAASSTVTEPLLYRKREYLDAIEADGTISSTQKTWNPPDYGPDD